MTAHLLVEQDQSAWQSGRDGAAGLASPKAAVVSAAVGDRKGIVADDPPGVNAAMPLADVTLLDDAPTPVTPGRLPLRMVHATRHCVGVTCDLSSGGGRPLRRSTPRDTGILLAGRLSASMAEMRVPSGHRPLIALSAAEPTVIAPEGELDVARVDEFRAALWDAAREGAAAVVVDLSHVTFIDSSGLGALVELHNRFQRSGRRLGLVVPAGSAPAVLLDLAGLRGRLPTSETREAALHG